MTGRDGNDVTDRQSIADIFATFYEQLYRRSVFHNEHATRDTDAPRRSADNDMTHVPIPLSHTEEVHQAIKQFKNGKCKDAAGITADMLKAGGTRMEQHLQCSFNDILQSDCLPPEQWRRTTMSVICNSADP